MNSQGIEISNLLLKLIQKSNNQTIKQSKKPENKHF